MAPELRARLSLSILVAVASGLQIVHQAEDYGPTRFAKLGAEMPDPFVHAYQARCRDAKPFCADRPRMLVMRGCSGSTAITEFARSLLRYHGIPVPLGADPRRIDGKPAPPVADGWPVELLKPDINWFYEKAGNHIDEAILLANTKMRSLNQTLFLKGMTQQIAIVVDWREVEDTFKKLGAFVVLGTRRNMLDQIICQIKDCFQPHYGHPVDSNGQDFDACFKRRNNTNMSEERNMQDERKKRKAEYLAHVEPSHLISHLDREYQYIDKARQNMNKTGLYFKEVDEEDLLDFQTGSPGSLERGVAAWNNLLSSLGVEPDSSLVKTYLQQFVGTYSLPRPHKELVHNMEMIEQVLKGHKYHDLIRS